MIDDQQQRESFNLGQRTIYDSPKPFDTEAWLLAILGCVVGFGVVLTVLLWLA